MYVLTYTILSMTIKDNNIHKLINVNLSSTINKCLLATTNLYMPNTCIDKNNFVNGNKPNNLNSNVCTLGYTKFSSPISKITEIKILSMTCQMVIVIYKLFFTNI